MAGFQVTTEAPNYHHDSSRCYGVRESVQVLPQEGEELDRATDELFDTVQVPPRMGEG
jgi:hypothetical protein